MRDVDLHCRRLSPPSGASLLSPEEHSRAARFHFPRDRNCYIACRSLLRELLAGYMNLAPAAVVFTCNSHGKPAVSGIYFNLAHCEDLAVFAISRTRQVGVDVERIRPMPDAFRVAERFFCRGEIEALRAQPEHIRESAFFRCWTRKEAYIKARGLGLSIPLSSFEVNVDDPAAFVAGVEGWSIESFEPEPGYIAAVVASG